MALDKILVIIDPTADQQPAFERGLDSARDTGALLHLYLCVDEQAGYASLEDARSNCNPCLKDWSAARSRRATKLRLNSSGRQTGRNAR